MTTFKPVSTLSRQDFIELRYAGAANETGLGLYCHVVRKSGPVEELNSLVWRGLLTARFGRKISDCGYWLTPAGHAMLSKAHGERTLSRPSEGRAGGAPTPETLIQGFETRR